MEHTFSTTAAIRQHQQSVHNSLSTTPHSLYRISPTNNILGASIPCSKTSPTGATVGTGGLYTPTHHQTIINPSGGVSSYYRIPNLPVQHSQQTCNFGSTSSGVIGISENSYLQGGIHTTIGTGRFPLPPSINTSSVSSIHPSLSISSYSNNLSNVSNNSGYSNPSVESNVVRNIQYRHHILQNSQQQPIHMPNNHQNMNKNRYGNPQNNLQASVSNNTVSHADNSNSSSAVSNVKTLIHQISQSQKQPPPPQPPQHHQQQNYNNNVVAAAPSSNNTPPQNQNHPQYRIYKRGDSIPGIPSPIQISSTTTNNENNGNSNNQNTTTKSNNEAPNALNVGDRIDNPNTDSGQSAEGLSINDKENNSNGGNGASGKDSSSLGVCNCFLFRIHVQCNGKNNRLK